MKKEIEEGAEKLYVGNGGAERSTIDTKTNNGDNVTVIGGKSL